MKVPQHIIQKKRNGGELTAEEIRSFLNDYVSGDIPDHQMSALLMAVYFSGLSCEELATWTNVMIQSGERLSFDHPHVVDKHSTGGVGDKTSLIIAPMVAALGCWVPMISGRSLGHTGGTLDKLESIPGFKIPQTAQQIKQLTEKHGLCFAGQTPTMCPLDRKLYALRDVTGTVESPDLIAASIMSKKLSEGIRGLTLDVKCGSGAFMKTLPDAQKLRNRMSSIAAANRLKLNGVISNMDQPLGRYAGVRPEIYEVLQVYRGEGPEDLVSLCVELAAHMLVAAGKENAQQAHKKAEQVLRKGQAYQKFCEIIQAQGGDVSTFETPKFYLECVATHTWKSETSGYVVSMDTEALGRYVGQLGAGRAQTHDTTDPQVGCQIHKHLGEKIKAGEPTLTLYLGRKSDRVILQKPPKWIEIGASPPTLQPLIQEAF